MTHDSPTANAHRPDRARPAAAALEAVAEAVSRLRFGVVQLTVHDGKVVQLDVTDRLRFT